MSYKEYCLPYKRIEHLVSLPQLELLATSHGDIYRELFLTKININIFLL